MIEWLLVRLGLVIFLVIFISQVVRAVWRSRKVRAEHEARRDEPSEARRLREVQEHVRRQIAARREGVPLPPPSLPPSTPSAPTLRPIPRPTTTQMPEPFGGPLGRMLEELQKRVQHPPDLPPPDLPPPLRPAMRNTAELERQQRLADDFKAVQDSRAVVERRAAQAAAGQRAIAESEPALRSAARTHVLADLKDPASLRRALVLREVLGPPVGLR